VQFIQRDLWTFTYFRGPNNGASSQFSIVFSSN
jgi:hypothetical protein